MNRYASRPDEVYVEPGDLIKIKRKGYQHWAVYVGEGYVIHVTSARAGDGDLPSMWTGKAVIKKEQLNDVVKRDRYCVSNKHDAKYPPPDPRSDRRSRKQTGRQHGWTIMSSPTIVSILPTSCATMCP
ncbi:phospholipase A and acyltransferase 3-like [Erythrolamprus reginae]|uniref:phospholipase A and acyltransferase 3-like n=1 Tax=Erythrolamprus reginae TaxID=121349 RepID=UPI00396C73CA